MKKTPQRLPEGIRRLASGKYQARYPVTRDGKVVQLSAGTFTTIADAKDARAVKVAELKTGQWVSPEGPRTRVKDWAVKWRELSRRRDLRMDSMLRKHIVPRFGHRELGDLTPIDVQEWVNVMADSGLAPGTVRAVYATFKRMMAKAVDYDLLVKTPCRAIDLPAERATEIVRLSAADLLALEREAPHRYRAMVHLSAWAGLRWQECAALRWENVDLERGVVNVCEALKITGEVGPPKNGKARLVPIAPVTVEVLRAHRRDFGLSELVFTSARGHRLTYTDFRVRVWGPTVDRVGLQPRPTYHDLRHGHAGHMVAQGMDWKVLSERLGHHKPSFTADRYGWSRPDHAEVSVAAIERAMGS